mmetsp:Transcript_42387/g.99499  ORF Transcript_42387/g.99499 Transcript_42387/m.99499 type:complete len:272 (+) Transcript_42387:115-930(+)
MGVISCIERRQASVDLHWGRAFGGPATWWHSYERRRLIRRLWHVADWRHHWWTLLRLCRKLMGWWQCGMGTAQTHRLWHGHPLRRRRHLLLPLLLWRWRWLVRRRSRRRWLVRCGWRWLVRVLIRCWWLLIAGRIWRCWYCRRGGVTVGILLRWRWRLLLTFEGEGRAVRRTRVLLRHSRRSVLCLRLWGWRLLCHGIWWWILWHRWHWRIRRISIHGRLTRITWHGLSIRRGWHRWLLRVWVRWRRRPRRWPIAAGSLLGWVARSRGCHG